MNTFTRRLLPTASKLTSRTIYYPTSLRTFHTTPHTASNPADPDAMPDSLASQSFKGKTGGGEPLESTSPGAPPEPKISNLSVPGKDGKEGREQMTDEQRREVEEHNKEFERTHEGKERHQKVEGSGGGRMVDDKKGSKGGDGKGGKDAGEGRMKGPPKDSKGGYEY